MPEELSVPIPQIGSDYIGPDNSLKKKQEEPIIFTLGPVLKSDGSVVPIEEVNSSGFYIYREEDSGETRLWNKNSSEWAPAADVPIQDRELNLLQYVKEDPDNPWKGWLVFLGPDGKFEPTVTTTGFPRYFIRCYFESEDPQHTIYAGEGDKSIVMLLPGLGADINVGLKVKDMQKELMAGLEFQNKKNPEWVEYFIKNVPGPHHSSSVKLEKNGNVSVKSTGNIKIEQDAGFLKIKHDNAHISIGSNGDIEVSQNTGDAQVKLENTGSITISNNNASITIENTGNIKLSPIDGGKVTIEEKLEVSNINGRLVNHLPYGPI